MELEARAAVHAALGDPHRLAVVDALWTGDRTPSELAAELGIASNLLAFHLDVLEEAGVVGRHRSEGDGRRRYVVLRDAALLGAGVAVGGPLPAGPVLFVCSHNAARSQLAAALWRARTGGEVASAGATPADRVHPLAVEVAAAHGLALGAVAPVGYDEVRLDPAVVVSVCDRARESEPPFGAPLVHWSVADPVGGDRAAFEAAFVRLEARTARLAPAVAA